MRAPSLASKALSCGCDSKAREMSPLFTQVGSNTVNSLTSSTSSSRSNPTFSSRRNVSTRSADSNWSSDTESRPSWTCACLASVTMAAWASTRAWSDLEVLDGALHLAPSDLHLIARPESGHVLERHQRFHGELGRDGAGVRSASIGLRTRDAEEGVAVKRVTCLKLIERRVLGALVHAPCRDRSGPRYPGRSIARLPERRHLRYEQVADRLPHGPVERSLVVLRSQEGRVVLPSQVDGGLEGQRFLSKSHGGCGHQGGRSQGQGSFCFAHIGIQDSRQRPTSTLVW